MMAFLYLIQLLSLQKHSSSSVWGFPHMVVEMGKMLFDIK